MHPLLSRGNQQGVGLDGSPTLLKKTVDLVASERKQVSEWFSEWARVIRQGRKFVLQARDEASDR